jgi:glyoxylase-like metal-dependent hydrolase (beta-lactamase superfamily II)
VIFRQLFDPETSTYTYLLADERTREAVLIDSVREQIERDRALLRELDLALRYAVETHVHADHVTASGRLREDPGCKVVVSALAGVRNADVLVRDGDRIRAGSVELEARPTPGHTSGCTTYVCHAARMAFTGDALLIRGCGRTDFQGGSPETLYRSVRERIFSLPDDYLLYPGHDYRGRMVTTVAEEKRWNPRLGERKSQDEFVRIMRELKLAYPKKMDVAVPANLESGLLELPAPGTAEPTVASVIESRGRQDADAWLGMHI